MSALQTIDPRWIKDDGTDRVPDIRTVTPYPVILARLADIMNTALDTVDCDDVDDAHDIARAITFRVLARADIERRSLHSMWHGNVTTGDTENHSPVPDVMTRARAKTRATRSNSGATVNMVSVHGRAYVTGDTTVLPNREHSMSANVARAMLDDAPRATIGHDAIAIYRATQALYGDSIPDLIGADVVAYHEFRSWDDVRARTPRKGYGTRVRLATARARNGQPNGATHTDDDGRRITQLLAPAADAEHVWIGHKLHTRAMTVRMARALKARAVDDALLIRDADDVAHVLASIADSATVPYRATWSVIDRHGRETGTRGALTITRSGMSVTGIPGTVQVKARTVAALRKNMARALAS